MLKAFLLSRLVRTVNPTLNSARQRFDAILRCRTQKRRGVELDIFVRLALELKKKTESLLDVIERKPKTGRDPKLHQCFG